MGHLVAGLFEVLGLENSNGRWYLWWSGFFPNVAIFFALAAFYWRHTCHVGRCWRIGRRAVEGTSYTVCHRHHPDAPPTHERVLHLHRLHLQRKAEEAAK